MNIDDEVDDRDEIQTIARSVEQNIDVRDVRDVIDLLLVDDVDERDEELDIHMKLDVRDVNRLDVIDESDDVDEIQLQILAEKLDLDDDEVDDDDDEDSEIDERDERDDVDIDTLQKYIVFHIDDRDESDEILDYDERDELDDVLDEYCVHTTVDTDETHLDERDDNDDVDIFDEIDDVDNEFQHIQLDDNDDVESFVDETDEMHDVDHVAENIKNNTLEIDETRSRTYIDWSSMQDVLNDLDVFVRVDDIDEIDDKHDVEDDEIDETVQIDDKWYTHTHIEHQKRSVWIDERDDVLELDEREIELRERLETIDEKLCIRFDILHISQNSTLKMMIQTKPWKYHEKILQRSRDHHRFDQRRSWDIQTWTTLQRSQIEHL